MKRAEISAMLDSDLPVFLQEEGLLDAFNKGQLKCFHCDRPINAENIHAVFRREGKIAFCCTSSNCTRKLSEEAKK